MNIGDKAPEILGINEKGEEIRLSDYKGKKIVLYFYPKDSTSGCTAQACNLRDNYTDLRKAGYEVIGVSVDNEKSHQKFIEKNNLPFYPDCRHRQEVGRTIRSMGRKKVCTDVNIWVHSVQLSSLTKKA